MEKEQILDEIGLEQNFLGSIESGQSLPTDVMPEHPMPANIAS